MCCMFSLPLHAGPASPLTISHPHRGVQRSSPSNQNQRQPEGEEKPNGERPEMEMPTHRLLTWHPIQAAKFMSSPGAEHLGPFSEESVHMISGTSFGGQWAKLDAIPRGCLPILGTFFGQILMHGWQDDVDVVLPSARPRLSRRSFRKYRHCEDQPCRS